jgi:hypothetical protein
VSSCTRHAKIFISGGEVSNEAIRSSTRRSSTALGSNDFPSVIRPLGNSSSTTKTTNGFAPGRNDVKLSEGDASSGIATTQERAVGEIDEHHEDGLPSFDDGFLGTTRKQTIHLTKKGNPINAF